MNIRAPNLHSSSVIVHCIYIFCKHTKTATSPKHDLENEFQMFLLEYMCKISFVNMHLHVLTCKLCNHITIEKKI